MQNGAACNISDVCVCVCVCHIGFSVYWIDYNIMHNLHMQCVTILMHVVTKEQCVFNQLYFISYAIFLDI